MNAATPAATTAATRPPHRRRRRGFRYWLGRVGLYTGVVVVPP